MQLRYVLCQLALGDRVRRTFASSIVGILVLSLAANGQTEHDAASLVWSDFQSAAVVRITVTCKSVAQEKSSSAGAPSVGSGFLLSDDVLVTARHLLLACSNELVEAVDVMSEDLLAQRKEQASRNLGEIRIEYPSGAVESFAKLDKATMLATNDFAYISLPRSLNSQRPRLCLARSLSPTRGQVVTMFGYGSGNRGRSVAGRIVDARDANKLAESDMRGGQGFSGAPVTNGNGRVIGMNVAQSRGTTNALVLPLARAVNMLSDEGLLSTLEREPSVAWDDRFKRCEVRTSEPIAYRSTLTIENDSGWRGGGSDPTAQCLLRINREKSKYPPNARYEISKSSEDQRWAGQFNRDRQYRYYCTIIIKNDPVYPVRRDESCGLRDPIQDPLDCN